MNKIDNEKSKTIQFIENFLIINFFLVIIFAVFFFLAVFMQINGNFVFINLFRKIWQPIVAPLISLLIFSSLIMALNSWLKTKVLPQDEDI